MKTARTLLKKVRKSWFRKIIKPFIAIKYKSLFAFNKELLVVASKIIGQELEAEAPKKKAVGMFFIGKAYKTIKALLILCHEGYGEDAAALVRNLFDMNINMLFMFEDKSDDRVTRYFQYDWYERARIYKEYGSTRKEVVESIKARGLDPKPHDVSLDEVLENAKIVTKEHKFTNSGWSKESLKEKSKTVGRITTYKSVFNLLSQLGHTSPRSMDQYLKLTPSGNYVVEVDPRDNWVETDLIISFDLFWNMLAAFDKEAKLDLGKELKGIEDRYLKEVKKINKR